MSYIFSFIPPLIVYTFTGASLVTGVCFSKFVNEKWSSCTEVLILFTLKEDIFAEHNFALIIFAFLPLIRKNNSHKNRWKLLIRKILWKWFVFLCPFPFILKDKILLNCQSCAKINSANFESINRSAKINSANISSLRYIEPVKSRETSKPENKLSTGPYVLDTTPSLGTRHLEH